MFSLLCRFQNGLSAVLTSSCALRVHLSALPSLPSRISHDVDVAKADDLQPIWSPGLAGKDVGTGRWSFCWILAVVDSCWFWFSVKIVKSAFNVICRGLRGQDVESDDEFTIPVTSFLVFLPQQQCWIHCASSRKVKITNTITYTASCTCQCMQVSIMLHGVYEHDWQKMYVANHQDHPMHLRAMCLQCVCLMHTFCTGGERVTGAWASELRESWNLWTSQLCSNFLRQQQIATLSCGQLPCWRL